jgi:tetratricopeptide (TPR) repeat protein
VCLEDLAGLIHIENEHLIHYNTALALAREGRLDQADAELGLSLRIEPDFVPALVLGAKVSARQQRWDEAHAQVQRALALAPQDAATARLAEEIRQAVEHTEVRELQAEEAARQARRSNAEKTLAMYQRDLITAFAAGAGLIAVISWLFSGRRGRQN